jgi:hypothetical protein
MNIGDNLLRLKVFLNDENKKGWFRIAREFLDLWIMKGNFPLHYFGRFLYRRDIGNYRDYLDMKEYRAFIYSKKMNQDEYFPILNNKLVFSVFCEKNQLPTPKVIGYNLQNDFFYNGRCVRMSDITEIHTFFKTVFEANGIDKLFVKSLCGYGGKEVYVLNHSNLLEDLKSVGNDLTQHAFVHQEAIVQHDAISRIYDHSVNTLRIDTYIDNRGDTHILGCAMRFGSGGEQVDNVSSGGFFVPVDAKSGKLTKKAMQGMIYGGRECSEHPDTGFAFEDFEIPYFQDAMKLCYLFSRNIPLRLAGWDVAITPTGPVVLEGNHTPYILMGEFAYGGYVKHPLYDEMMSNI